ncbi:hypothetical protein [Nocardiopsis gilva]|uniref:hypothetical protein n=1 Tax=Nocardiopsis gilva TaxID=280236 RepID=UPI0018DFA9F5|nr:hypothetical protein [Nocardiopsis gilva]
MNIRACPIQTANISMGPCGGLLFRAGRRVRDVDDPEVRRAGAFFRPEPPPLRAAPPPERWEDLGDRVAMALSLLRKTPQISDKGPRACRAPGATLSVDLGDVDRILVGITSISPRSTKEE